MSPAASPTAALAAEGVSIWLDDLSRQRILSGDLQRLISQREVVGVTTNPTIFAAAIGGSTAYDEQVAALAQGNRSASDVVFALTTDDVARAADLLRPVFDASGGVDGWVSIEVGADAAHDTLATLVETRSLAEHIDRPNVFVKIPATVEGVAAITAAIALGISVNVTLIFGLDRYRAVVDAYLTGLERAHESGLALRGIRSVASFFVSRVDTEVDRRLDEIGTAAARELRSLAGIANARLAYEIFTSEFAGARAQRLLALGANVQRPLWASTGAKDPALPDTRYVEELVARDVVNTMPEKTLEAVFDHGRIRGDTITGTADESRAVLAGLAALGISYDEVTATLEREGVAKFQASGDELVATVAAALERARTGRP
ncbi:transaldolase [Agromyces cerinus]|uniref:transaldolase n=1 Tax=Agromyces cerinus TaxID=33878 RepID=UPI00195BF487|nr:transaldolase [Agromyces cerinus]MBM7830657.1 transaldolase [Agromyces cerinus]